MLAITGGGWSPRRPPAPPSPLIGRESEIGPALEILRQVDTRLLTLDGPAGVGKSRLALQVAATFEAEMQDGACFVDLAPVPDAARVEAAVALALGLNVAPDVAGAAVQRRLVTRRMLLVLDNFEHVLGAAPWIANLLAGCPGLKVLATSRERLHLRWEHVLRVPPLSLPDLTRRPVLEELRRSPAVQLLLARARSVRREFALTTDNATVIAEIAMRLDGLPLAIELAAARLQVYSPQMLLGRLQNSLDVLGEGARDLHERHRSLRAAIDWSYATLTPDEQALLRRMGIFAGGVTVEAAEAVASASAPGEGDVAGVLALLARKSLLNRADTADSVGSTGEARYAFLQTIRAYALDQLESSGEAADTWRRAADYFATVAEQAESDVSRGNHIPSWSPRLLAERENLTAVARWCREHDEAARGLRLAAALWFIWLQPSDRAQALGLLEDLLGDTSGAQPDRVRARALRAAGLLSSASGALARARALHEDSLALCRRLGDEHGTALALRDLAAVARVHGKLDVAQRLLQEAAAIWQVRGDDFHVALSMTLQGDVALDVGDLAAARAYYERSQARFIEIGSRWGSGVALRGMAAVAEALGRLEQAQSGYESSLAILAETGDRSEAARVQAGLGRVLTQQREYRRASALIIDSLVAAHSEGQMAQVATCLEDLAQAFADPRPTRAAWLLGAAAGLRSALDAPLPPERKSIVERIAWTAEQLLGETAYDSAWTAGRALDIEQAVALALTRDEDVRTPAEGAERRAGSRPLRGHARGRARVSHRMPAGEVVYLTRREGEVAGLVARGLSNREIARLLVITERTAETHVGNILQKLGLVSRAQLIVWVADQLTLRESRRRG